MCDGAKPTGVVGALLALADLREAVETIRHDYPAYYPGSGPTAGDALNPALMHLDHTLRLVGVYLGDLKEEGR